MQSARQMAIKAREASRQLQVLPTATRVAILNRIADSIESHEAQIMAENAQDVEAAGGKISEALLQRLILKPAKLKLLAGGRQVAAGQGGAVSSRAGLILHPGRPPACGAGGAGLLVRQRAARWDGRNWDPCCLNFSIVALSAALQTASAPLRSKRSPSAGG